MSSTKSLAGKKLLLLDGSRKAIEIVEHAQRMGIHTIVSDYSDPRESPAKFAADQYFDVSTTDVDAIVALIRQESIDGALPGFSDRWLPVYAEICERAGIPFYATPEQLRLFTNKESYKGLLQKFDVPTVDGFTFEEAVSDKIPVEAFPLIVKPAGGSGSRGIHVCQNAEQLKNCLEGALSVSWAGKVVIERFLPGEEATIFWVFQDGEYFPALLANRHMMTFADGKAQLPIGYTFPSYLTPKYLDEVAPKVKIMLQSVGIRNGIMFMQGLVDDFGNFLTYDIGYRPTPSKENWVLEELCGYNPLSMLIRFAVTGSMGEPELAVKADPTFNGYGFNVSTLAMPGRIGAINGLDETSQMPDVLSVTTSLAVGDELPPESLGQLRQVVIRTVGATRTSDELECLIKQIMATLSVEADDGSPLTVPVADIEDLAERLL